jgi:hypothetical protein
MNRLAKLIRTIVPTEVQMPPNLFKKALAWSGCFKLRTIIAAHGAPVPDARLYQPLFSPWQGQPCSKGSSR